MSGRRAGLVPIAIALTLALASAGCLKTLQGAMGDGEELIWDKKAEFSVSFTPTDALTGANPNGATHTRNFTLPLGTEMLRAGFAVTLESPGNVTARVVSPHGAAYSRSFSEPGDYAPVFETQDPEPGQWRVTIEALGQGEATARVDARVPVTS